ncbi:hypothetical protein ACFL5Z_11435 [Planctomycetota bacterium]
MVFDPEYKNLDCPQCHLRRIYFDRDIGYYCMSCGQEISYDEICLLIEKAQKASPPIPPSGKSEIQPPVEIKELPPTKARESKRAGKNKTEHDTSEHV